MTAPQITPAETGSTTDDEVVHIRCMNCRVEPMRSVCGELLDAEGEQSPGTADCPRCNELYPLHREVLHPHARTVVRRR